MPNHCHNRVTFYGSGNDTDETRTQIAKLKQIFEDESCFGQIIPEPDWPNTPLDEHVQRLDNSGHYKYPAISQPGSS